MVAKGIETWLLRGCMDTYHRNTVRVIEIIIYPDITGREIFTTCVFGDVNSVVE